MIEARGCIGCKHDQIAAYNMHPHKSAYKEHGPDSVVLTKGIFQWMHIKRIDTSAAIVMASIEWSDLTAWFKAI